MIPTTLTSAGVIVLAVLPGALYTWSFERQVSAYGATLADRLLRLLALSVLFHLALGWPEYLAWDHAIRRRATLDTSVFAAAWGAVGLIVLLPFIAGTVIGGLYATRTDRDGWPFIRRMLSAEAETRILQLLLGKTPAPRAWDNLFSERPSVYLRIETTDGAAVAGIFADRSYAGGFPNDPDLYLEQAWSLRDDGALGDPLGYAVYLPAGQIARMEILIPEEADTDDADDNLSTGD